MEESTTAQWWLDRGDARGLKRTLLRLGSRKLGSPRPEHEAAINALTEDDLEKLDLLTDRVQEVASWDELLAV